MSILSCESFADGRQFAQVKPLLTCFAACSPQICLADSTRQCNFTYDMKREAAMSKCFSPSKVKEHECEPTTASLRVSVTKFMH